MKYTLPKVVKGLTQMITKTIHKCKIAICLTFGVFLNNANVHSQINSSVDEKTRSLIFMSYEIDGPYKYNTEKWDKLLILLKNHHDNLPIEVSEVYHFILPRSIDTITDGYSLQVFKVACDNSRKQSRYLLKYKGFSGTLWLRVGGYVENDIKVFLDYLRTKGVKKKDLYKIVESWENMGGLFKEIDFTCLLKGYLRHRTSSDCFIAVSYVNLLDLSVGFDPISEKDIYSVFSRVPLFDGVMIKKN